MIWYISWFKQEEHHKLFVSFDLGCGKQLLIISKNSTWYIRMSLSSMTHSYLNWLSKNKGQEQKSGTTYTMCPPLLDNIKSIKDLNRRPQVESKFMLMMLTLSEASARPQHQHLLGKTNVNSRLKRQNCQLRVKAPSTKWITWCWNMHAEPIQEQHMEMFTVEKYQMKTGTLLLFDFWLNEQTPWHRLQV